MENSYFSAETEEKILAILIKNGSGIVDNNLQPFMFGSAQNAALFSVIMELETASAIDKSLLIEYLKSKRLLDKVGGVPYIEYLYSIDSSLEDFNKYVEILISFYKARALIRLVSRVHQTNLSSDSVDQIISSLIQELENITSVGSEDVTLDLYSALRLSWKELQEKISGSKSIGVPFGIENIDSVVGGIDRGDLWIIGARPSMGKTALMCNSALSTAKKGNKVLILSLEMGRQAIVERILAIETGIPVFNLRLGILNQQDVDKLEKAVSAIKDLPIYINTKFMKNLDSVEAVIRKQKSLYDIDIAYVDYIQLLTSRDEDATQDLGRISQRLKSIAKDLKIGVCALSQLSREVEKRPNKRPVLSDLRQSGYLEEDADLVAFLYRDLVYNPGTSMPNVMEFIIRKQRNGSIGNIPLTFEAETNKIY